MSKAVKSLRSDREKLDKAAKEFRMVISRLNEQTGKYLNDMRSAVYPYVENEIERLHKMLKVIKEFQSTLNWAINKNIAKSVAKVHSALEGANPNKEFAQVPEYFLLFEKIQFPKVQNSEETTSSAISRITCSCPDDSLQDVTSEILKAASSIQPAKMASKELPTLAKEITSQRQQKPEEALEGAMVSEFFTGLMPPKDGMNQTKSGNELNEMVPAAYCYEEFQQENKQPETCYYYPLADSTMLRRATSDLQSPRKPEQLFVVKEPSGTSVVYQQLVRAQNGL